MNYPILALIIANVIWGATPPIIKYALENIPPFTLAFLRFILASLVFLPLAIKHWQKIAWKDIFIIILAGFFGITINISFFFLGLLKGGVSINAPIIISSGPIFLYLLSIIFLHEKPKKRIFSGMLISLIGVLLLIFSPIILSGKLSFNTETIANLFFVVATIGSILSPLIAKGVLKRVNIYQFTWIAFVISTIPFLILSYFELQSWSFMSLNYQGIIGIIFGWIFASSIAYFLFFFGVSKIKAQEIGLFTYIDPIVAVLIAWPLLGEKPNLIYVISALLVFGGIFFAEKRIPYHPVHRLKT